MIAKEVISQESGVIVTDLALSLQELILFCQISYTAFPLELSMSSYLDF